MDCTWSFETSRFSGQTSVYVHYEEVEGLGGGDDIDPLLSVQTQHFSLFACSSFPNLQRIASGIHFGVLRDMLHLPECRPPIRSCKGSKSTDVLNLRSKINTHGP